MGRSSSGEQFERTDLFDPKRNDVIAPSDNFSDARLPQRQCAQDRCDNRSDRYSNNSELQAFKEGYRQAYRDGFMDGQRQQPVRVGRGQGSYCPEYNDFANGRQAYQEEAWLNRGDSYDQRPIPQCRHRQQSRYDNGPSRYGDVQAVSAGQYDYDYPRQHDRLGRGPLDQFFNAIGSIARGIGDVAYEAAPIIQTWAQIEMIKQGRVGGHYFGGYDNGYYNQRPFNPWSSRQNRDLIAYNNNSGYYDNRGHNDRYYQPSWLNG